MFERGTGSVVKRSNTPSTISGCRRTEEAGDIATSNGGIVGCEADGTRAAVFAEWQEPFLVVALPANNPADDGFEVVASDDGTVVHGRGRARVKEVGRSRPVEHQAPDADFAGTAGAGFLFADPRLQQKWRKLLELDDQMSREIPFGLQEILDLVEPVRNSRGDVREGRIAERESGRACGVHAAARDPGLLRRDGDRDATNGRLRQRDDAHVLRKGTTIGCTSSALCEKEPAFLKAGTSELVSSRFPGPKVPAYGKKTTGELVQAEQVKVGWIYTQMNEKLARNCGARVIDC
jgi:hypothetical protein